MLSSSESEHQTIDVLHILLVQAHKASDAARAGVAMAGAVRHALDILFLRAQLGKVLRHTDGNQEAAQRLDTGLRRTLGMLKVHLAAPHAKAACAKRMTLCCML